MKTLIVCALLVCATAAAAADSPDQTVTRNLAARGGVENIQKLTTLVVHMHSSDGRSEVVQAKAGGLLRVDATEGGRFASLLIVDGQWKWLITAVSPFPQQQATLAIRTDVFDAIDPELVDYGGKGIKVALGKQRKSGSGRRCTELKLEASGKATEVSCLDDETGLEIERYFKGSDRRYVFADYRAVGGVLIPFQISETDYGVSRQWTVDGAEANCAIDNAHFNWPAPFSVSGIQMSEGIALYWLKDSLQRIARISWPGENGFQYGISAINDIHVSRSGFTLTAVLNTAWTAVDGGLFGDDRDAGSKSTAATMDFSFSQIGGAHVYPQAPDGTYLTSVKDQGTFQLGNGPADGHFPFADHDAYLHFVDAVNWLKYMADRSGSDDDSASFDSQAATWRDLPSKPALPDEVHKQRLLAEDAVANKEFVSAISHYEAGLKLYPTWPEGWFNRALLYAEIQGYGDAVTSMKRYLELAPNSPDAEASRDQIVIWEDKIKAGNSQ